MPAIIFLLVFATATFATDLTVLLQSVHENHPKVALYKSRLQQLHNDATASLALEPLSLNSNAAWMDDQGDTGIEYAVGIEQQLPLPGSYRAAKKARDFHYDAASFETEHAVHIFELDIAHSYYRSCIAKEMLESVEILQTQQEQTLERQKKAHSLGEISNKTLLFYQLEALRAEERKKRYALRYETAFMELQESIGSEFLTVQTPECDDILPPTAHIALKPFEEHSLLQQAEARRNAALAEAERYSASIDTLTLSVDYEHELAAERYVAGVSLPLAFTSNKNEANKKAALARVSEYSAQKRLLASRLKDRTEMSAKRLQTLHETLESMNTHLLPAGKQLSEMAQKAFESGEGSLLEYIEIQRDYQEKMLQTLDVKSEYYDTLFELFKLNDLPLGALK